MPCGRRLIFWQYCLTPHQATFFRALAAREGHRVTLVVQEGVPAFRREMGWRDPDYGETEVLIAPPEAEWRALARLPEREALQIFSPARAFPLVWEAYGECLRAGNRVGILSEQFDWTGPRGAVRLLQGRVDAIRWRSRIRFILAIGHTGVRWFRLCGYPESRIFPFGYFVDDELGISDAGETTHEAPASVPNVIYLGTCTKQKGVDVLLRALAQVKDAEWTLRVVGDGPTRATLERMSTDLGIVERTEFAGYLPITAVRAELRRSDLLVLPSRAKEGWGAVVNEALVCGVPVVCSDLCGAADLLRDSVRGETFPAGSVSALAGILSRRLSQGKRTPETTEAVQNWSRRISGDVVAEYMVAVFEAACAGGPRPIPPWLA